MWTEPCSYRNLPSACCGNVSQWQLLVWKRVRGKFAVAKDWVNGPSQTSGKLIPEGKENTQMNICSPSAILLKYLVVRAALVLAKPPEKVSQHLRTFTCTIIHFRKFKLIIANTRQADCGKNQNITQEFGVCIGEESSPLEVSYVQ